MRGPRRPCSILLLAALSVAFLLEVRWASDSRLDPCLGSLLVTLIHALLPRFPVVRRFGVGLGHPMPPRSLPASPSLLVTLIHAILFLAPRRPRPRPLLTQHGPTSVASKIAHHKEPCRSRRGVETRRINARRSASPQAVASWHALAWECSLQGSATVAAR